jgi:hypothetical protein
MEMTFMASNSCSPCLLVSSSTSRRSSGTAVLWPAHSSCLNGPHKSECHSVGSVMALVVWCSAGVVWCMQGCLTSVVEVRER